MRSVILSAAGWVLVLVVIGCDAGSGGRGGTGGSAKSDAGGSGNGGSITVDAGSGGSSGGETTDAAGSADDTARDVAGDSSPDLAGAPQGDTGDISESSDDGDAQQAPGAADGAISTGCADELRADRYAPGLDKIGKGSLLRVALVSSEPGPPIKGTNTWSIAVSDAAGAPVTDAAINVTPYMPDHNHGTSVKAVVTPLPDGRYSIAPLYFFMTGLWQTTLQIHSVDRAINDSVMFSFCVEDNPSGADAATGNDGATVVRRLLPWQVGNRWTYRVNLDGVASTKTSTVMDRQVVGGTGPHRNDMAFKVETQEGPDDSTVSYEELIGDAVVVYREISHSPDSGMADVERHWAPYKVRVGWTPAHIIKGDPWLEDREETTMSADRPASTARVAALWNVVDENASVTVPAGTFQTIRLQKVEGDSVTNTWYAWDVGKVKEAGSRLEELVSYSLQP